ncbi:hypothetical protein EMCRGX_G015210 [Ephydatia muelleri]
MSEAGVTAGAAAQATELRKHEANDVKCSELVAEEVEEPEAEDKIDAGTYTADGDFPKIHRARNGNHEHSRIARQMGYKKKGQHATGTSKNGTTYPLCCSRSPGLDIHSRFGFKTKRLCTDYSCCQKAGISHNLQEPVEHPSKIKRGRLAVPTISHVNCLVGDDLMDLQVEGAAVAMEVDSISLGPPRSKVQRHSRSALMPGPCIKLRKTSHV